MRALILLILHYGSVGDHSDDSLELLGMADA